MIYRYFIDIESLPPPEEMRQRLSPAKIRKLLRVNKAPTNAAEEPPCTEEEFRQLALHPEYGRVLSIGMIVEQDAHIIHRGVLGREKQSMRFHLDEARTLKNFWKLLSNFNVNRDLIISHNGLCFDLPFILKRSLINRIRPSVKLPFARYRTQPIYDTMQVWSNWDPRQFLSLSDLAEVLKVGVSKTAGMDGSKVYDQFRAGHHQEIAEYNLNDVIVLRAVYYAMEYPEGAPPEL
jgi:predicted PolB exonuclease-like 3'-5' exonuclease